MAKVEKFDKQTLGSIRADISDALKAVEAKYGIVLSLGNISFMDDTFSSKLTAVTEKASNGAAESGDNAKYAKAFLTHCVYFGLARTDLGRAMIYKGATYTLVGARPRAKFPFVLKGADGKLIAVAENVVKLGLK